MKKTYKSPRTGSVRITSHIMATSAVNINHNDNDAIDAANSLTKGNNNDEQKPWYK